MASSGSGVWAIDIGNNSLKALHMVRGADGFEVVGFDYVEHARILTGEDVDDEIRQRLISDTLTEFTSRNEMEGEEVAISIAGHNSFARFIKLPPVEKKRIPEIVQFEAVQQIPFDINEVEWGWQVMDNPDTPDTEVGIFAIKNEVINGIMDHFTREDMKIGCVQIAPMALYNYAIEDIKDIGGFNEKATVILDMGAENTTLVVCSQMGVWQRSIRIGGNAFSEAIADTFNLSFRKAEKLKRTAPMSKYMRQIFTAMKPVFTDLASEVQRSLGFYSSSGAGREKGFAKVIAVGGGMKLQGLAKYLQQTLNVPVVKPDTFESLKLGEGVSAAKFHENILDFGVCYGLGVQLLGESKIKVNLLPRKIARAIAWRRKSKMFALAAGLLVFVSVLSFVKANLDKAQYKSHEPERLAIQATIRSAQTAASNWKTAKDKDAGLKEIIKKEMVKFSNRDIVPSVNQMIMACLPNKENNPGQAGLYEAFVSGDVDAVLNVPRNERKQLFVTSISVTYAPALEGAKFSEKTKSGTRSSRMPEMGGRRGEMSSYEEYGRMPMGRGGMDPRGDYGGRGMPAPVSSKSAGATEDDTAEGPGFLVVIEGYSPYGVIGELLDPPSVGNDESKWGFVTRLVNVSKVVKGCPFELYKKVDRTHFVLDMGPVDLMTKDVPGGIGIEKEIERYVPEIETADRGGAAEYGGRMGAGGMRGMDRVYVETVLVDPMTNEEMSTVFDIITDEDVANDPALSEKDIGKKKFDSLSNEPLLIERDYWFRLKAKFRWKSAPELPEPAVDDMMGMGRY